MRYGRHHFLLKQSKHHCDTVRRVFSREHVATTKHVTSGGMEKFVIKMWGVVL